jgi:hypothetical protein
MGSSRLRCLCFKPQHSTSNLSATSTPPVAKALSTGTILGETSLQKEGEVFTAVPELFAERSPQPHVTVRRPKLVSVPTSELSTSASYLSLEASAQAPFSALPRIRPPVSLIEALISIGPNTDAVLDTFSLDDRLIPRLRILATTIRSNKWQAALRTPEWGLSFEQAMSLSNALQADVDGGLSCQAKVKLDYPLGPKAISDYPFNSSVLQILTAL